ncbi:hypothetical protein K0M31_012151 [Melipona bicolor]|uniref:E3 ubiquitin-protein ligase listerin n=1 Tax=Melipona bicolor TaxID=60889 RepID=A0AA40GAZ9_9HYME|nr:hypothetical protein K0M31_012151 [Melipona bicolor]
MEAKRQSVLISSLHGYSVYLNTVPIQEVEKMIELHNKIISSNNFWNLINTDVVPIKTAFFTLLTSMIDTNVMLQNEKKRTVTSIVNSLDEMYPPLSSAVWKSMHTAMNNIKDWYSVINIEKLFLPKLYRVLQNGGQCCASDIYPYLLPFISQFPKLSVDPHHLYTNFFTNMRQGFSVQSVRTDHYEALAVTTSFVECFGYYILLNVNNQDLINALLSEQLMPLLEMCLKEDGPLAQIFSYEITHLIRYWSKNRYNKDYKSYICLMEEFWRNLNTLFTSPVNISSQTAFLITLRMGSEHGRKNLEMKLCNSGENIMNQSQTQNVENDTDVKFLAELKTFVNSICVKCFNQITEKGYITYLNKLIAHFEGDHAFENLFELLNAQMNFFNFYNEILRSWLLEQRQDIEDITELMFNLMKYMNHSERNEIMESLTEVRVNSSFVFFLPHIVYM